MRIIIYSLYIVLISVSCGFYQRPQDQTLDKDTQKQVDELVNKLGNDGIEIREKAHKELIQLCLKRPAVIKYVKSYSASKDAEIAWRIKSILEYCDSEILNSKHTGIFANRAGKFKSDSLKEGGGSDKTEAVVAAALGWLARHQNDDGSWSIVGCTKNCGKSSYKGKCDPTEGDDEYDVGATGLALLAFLGSGPAPNGKDEVDGIKCSQVLKKGLEYIMSIQGKNGSIGRNSDHFMYNHVLAGLALVECCDMAGGEKLRDSAQRAVDFVIKAQNPDLGWRYTPVGGDNDSSITGWCAMFLKSAEQAKLAFPKTSYKGIKKWYDTVTDEATGIVGYDRKWTAKYPLGAVIRGLNGKDKFEIMPAVTAIGIMSKLFIDRNNKEKMIVDGIKKIQEYMPKWKEDRDADFYYWYNASYAMFQFYPPDSAEWKNWNKSLYDVLVTNKKQNNDGCKSGSWEPVDRWSCKGGRVAITALGALTLEVYYRFTRVVK